MIGQRRPETSPAALRDDLQHRAQRALAAGGCPVPVQIVLEALDAATRCADSWEVPASLYLAALTELARDQHTQHGDEQILLAATHINALGMLCTPPPAEDIIALDPRVEQLVLFDPLPA